VSISFVQDGDYEGMEIIYRSSIISTMCMATTKLSYFYTDNCCHEYNMVVCAMPSVSQDDMDALKQDPRRNLPDAMLPPHCTSLLEVIDACKDSNDSNDSNVMFDLGFNVEWDSLTQEDLHNQIPVVMQLAANGPQSILVNQIAQVFPGIVKLGGQLSAADIDFCCNEHNIFRRVLQHPKVRLVGVNVKGNISQVDKHYPEALLGSNLHGQVKDCAQMADKKHALLCWNEQRGLESMGENFLGLKMDKVSLTIA
jgi:hypothetical protein